MPKFQVYLNGKVVGNVEMNNERIIKTNLNEMIVPLQNSINCSTKKFGNFSHKNENYFWISLDF